MSRTQRKPFAQVPFGKQAQSRSPSTQPEDDEEDEDEEPDVDEEDDDEPSVVSVLLSTDDVDASEPEVAVVVLMPSAAGSVKQAPARSPTTIVQYRIGTA